MKVLCASMSGAGHSHPMAAVARALVARGHQVTFATGGSHAADAVRAGAAFWELPISRGSPRHALEPYLDAEDMARMMVPRVAELRPDVAVIDLITLGPALATEMCGIPHATLSIHPLHTPSVALPPFGYGRAPARGALKFRDAWMRRNALRDLERARDALNVARAHLGLPRTERLDAQLSGEMILVATLPSLEVARPDWPERAEVIGPCLWDAPAPAVTIPRGDEPLVLVAATTAHEDQAAMVRSALRAIVASGARGLVTAGASAASFKAPPRVQIVEFASHDDVLPFCSAVVCSGGHGIVARALSHGVPVVVVPGHGDQRENGYRVARAGAGLTVAAARPRSVARALRRVLSDHRFREAAIRIRDEAAVLNGPARAAELIERLAERERAPNPAD